MFSKRGLRLSLEKTDVMWVGPGGNQLEKYLDGKR